MTRITSALAMALIFTLSLIGPALAADGLSLRALTLFDLASIAQTEEPSDEPTEEPAEAPEESGEEEPSEEPADESPDDEAADEEAPADEEAGDEETSDDETPVEETPSDLRLERVEPPSEPESSSQLIVRAIEIRGNRRVPDERILLAMRMRPGDPFSATNLQEDLRRIGEMGVFASPPQALPETTSGGVKLVILVEENPLFQGLRVEIVKGPGLYPTGDLAAAFMNNPDAPLIVDQLISRAAIDAGAVAIQKHYRKDGYSAAGVVDVTTITEGPDTGLIFVKLNEGVIKDIKLVGNTKTDSAVILREITLKPGQVFDSRRLSANLRALYSLQLFDDISFEPEFTEDQEVIVVFKFLEARTGQLGFGVGYSSQDGVLGTLSYAERNFQGTGQSIRAGFQLGGPDPEGNLSYYMPYFADDGTSLGVELFRQSFTDTERDPDDPDLFAEYTSQRTGGEVKTVHPVGENLHASLSLKIIDGEITLSEDSTADLIDVSEFARRGLLDGTSNSVTIGLAHDTRDFALDPSSGSVQSGSAQFYGGPLGGDFDAIKILGEYKHYIRMGKELDLEGLTAATLPSPTVLALRLQVGAAHGNLSILDRFELGGNTSIRGTDFAAQTGSKMVLANVEYRFPVITNLSGAVFFDAGTAAQPGESLDFGNILTTVGAGIRYRIPFFGVAPLRIDYGFDLENGESRVVLGFGQLF